MEVLVEMDQKLEGVVVLKPQEEQVHHILAILDMQALPAAKMAAAVAAAGMAADLEQVEALILAVAAAPAMCGRRKRTLTLLQDITCLLPIISPMHLPMLATPRLPLLMAAMKLVILATAKPVSRLIAMMCYVNLMPKRLLLR